MAWIGGEKLRRGGSELQFPSRVAQASVVGDNPGGQLTHSITASTIAQQPPDLLQCLRHKVPQPTKVSIRRTFFGAMAETGTLLVQVAPRNKPQGADSPRRVVQMSSWTEGRTNFGPAALLQEIAASKLESQVTGQSTQEGQLPCRKTCLAITLDPLEKSF